jgi:hypothetical protein
VYLANAAKVRLNVQIFDVRRCRLLLYDNLECKKIKAHITKNAPFSEHFLLYVLTETFLKRVRIN